MMADYTDFSDSKYFYHVSRTRLEDKLLIPRIPLTVHKNSKEDILTPRICVSDSVCGCLTALPDSIREFKYRETVYGIEEILYIYKIPRDSIAIENIIPPTILKETSKVYDSLVSNEHWVINQNISLTEPDVIKLQGIDFDEAIAINPDDDEDCRFYPSKITDYSYEDLICEETFTRRFKFKRIRDVLNFMKLLKGLEGFKVLNSNSNWDLEGSWNVKYLDIKISKGTNMECVLTAYRDIRNHYYQEYDSEEFDIGNL